MVSRAVIETELQHQSQGSVCPTPSAHKVSIVTPFTAGSQTHLSHLQSFFRFKEVLDRCLHHRARKISH